MDREREDEEIEREIFPPSSCLLFLAIASQFSRSLDIFSLHFLIFSPFSHSLSISSPFSHSLAIFSLSPFPYFLSIFSFSRHFLSLSISYGLGTFSEMSNEVPQSARLSAGRGVQSLFGQCPNRFGMFFGGASLLV